MKKLTAAIIGVTLGLSQGVAIAEPADWSAIEAKEVTLFFPGISPMEWITGKLRIDRARHGGARPFAQGDTCLDCHGEELADMGAKIASGETLEPDPLAGRPGSIPLTVQAAHDGSNLYMRFSWAQPAAAGGDKMDADNSVKLAFMLDAGNVDMADRSGCWASCHSDSRTMPEGDANKTKYVKDGSVAAGVFYDLVQWRSSSNSGYAGYVADQRVLEASDNIVAAGTQDGDNWSVVIQRPLAGGEGDIALEAGKVYNVGFAIHNEHTAGRFHHVSMGYKLGIDAAGDISAKKF